MNENNAVEIEYIPREVFDIQLQRIIDSNRLERRIDNFDAKLDLTKAELNGRIDALEEKLNGRIDALDRKIDSNFNHLSDAIAIIIMIRLSLLKLSQ